MAKQIRITGDPGTLKPVVESIIFASDSPISTRMLLALVAGVDGEEPEPDGVESADSTVPPPSVQIIPETGFGEREVRALVGELNQEYGETGRSFRIVEVAGGFQFATLREYGEYVAMLSKERMRRRLSPAALETLAIIAYRQPVSKPEIESVRGVNCDQVLLSLIEKNLVAITGRSESVGRPLLYSTTDDFLRVFGLKDLKDMPKLRELEELMEEGVHLPENMEVVVVGNSDDVEKIEATLLEAGIHPQHHADTDSVQQADPGLGGTGDLPEVELENDHHQGQP